MVLISFEDYNFYVEPRHLEAFRLRWPGGESVKERSLQLCQRKESIMHFTPQITRKLLLVFPAILLGMVVAIATSEIRSARGADFPQQRQPRSASPRPTPTPGNAERQHQRRVQEGERASRNAPPSPPPRVPPNNGIQQIPIDTTTTRPLTKESQQVVREIPVSPPPPPPTSPPPPPCPYMPKMKTASLVKAFPEVTWHVCVTDMGLKGLWVGPVHLRRNTSSSWMWVLYQAGLAEIFVPYHYEGNNSGFRPYDLQWTSALSQVTSQDAGSNGWMVTLTNESIPTVVAEVRDRGVAWLCKQTTWATRRAEELLVWGVIDGGNYDNIIQYGFRDDGAMTFRLGNTGYNAPDFPSEEHMHNGLWRVDMDLNGAAGDTAWWREHSEPMPNTPLYRRAADTKMLFNGGLEGGLKWNAERFSSLLIEDAVTNVYGHRPGYEFTLQQPGISRHYEPGVDAWTQNDFYVTVWQPNEFAWKPTWSPPTPMPPDWLFPYQYLPNFLNNQSVSNRDLVIWIKASAHHEPIDEDRSVDDPTLGNITGVTLVHWSGFNVEPHNLFNTNPLGAPVRCGN